MVLCLSVGWHPSGSMLGSASFDATVAIWEHKDGGKFIDT